MDFIKGFAKSVGTIALGVAVGLWMKDGVGAALDTVKEKTSKAAEAAKEKLQAEKAKS